MGVSHNRALGPISACKRTPDVSEASHFWPQQCVNVKTHPTCNQLAYRGIRQLRCDRVVCRAIEAAADAATDITGQSYWWSNCIQLRWMLWAMCDEANMEALGIEDYAESREFAWVMEVQTHLHSFHTKHSPRLHVLLRQMMPAHIPAHTYLPLSTFPIHDHSDLVVSALCCCMGLGSRDFCYIRFRTWIVCEHAAHGKRQASN